ncbi:uncharacterized protein LOC110270111 [Arachis ipaensis]|uniref:uncharacterized protein LOC110270111 n=1 Tax=Arachis ipaensis TaxID=130454 RepID=UPI000A2B980B|nr:uncharacterized protein LOC110270111 [Arachis ipaensis]
MLQVLSRGGEAVQMTTDHEPNTERGSIENRGGFVSNMLEKRNFFWNRMDHMLQESQFTRGVRERLLRLGSNPMSSCNSYLQKVPAIVHGNLKLSESHAILLYLASAFTGIADHWLVEPSHLLLVT